MTINGAVQQIRQDGAQVTLPIQPGRQEISLEWREPTGLSVFYRTPRIDLGAGSVNVAIDVTLPQNRWPLFLGGPLMGPAILYWSTLLVVALAALVICKSGMTPLKFYQLFLLGIGMSMSMSMSNLFNCLLVVGWLSALHFRKTIKLNNEKNAFNLIQTGLGALTVLALMALVGAISQGLLGHPDMNIIGNGSSSSMLLEPGCQRPVSAAGLAALHPHLCLPRGNAGLGPVDLLHPAQTAEMGLEHRQRADTLGQYPEKEDQKEKITS